MLGIPTIRAYNATANWTETSVDWFESSAGVPWPAEGKYTTQYPGTSTQVLLQGWYYFDLFSPFHERYPSWPSASEISQKGFLIKVESGSSGELTFLSKECSDTSLRWSIEVTYYPNART